MPRLFPFRGYRYAEKVVGDLSHVVTQPYDKITADARQRYRGLSEKNVAHVISNPDYREAGACFAEWLRDGTLVRDPRPAFYVYRQSFEVSGRTLQRTGAIGLLDLDSGQAEVLRHERVMDAPLQDRLNLMAATEANDGLIFMLLDDPERAWEANLERILGEGEPAAQVRDELGVLNQLWTVPEPRSIADLQSLLNRERVYIADGHHRFETAIRFAEQCFRKQWRPGAVESFDKRMVALFSSRSPGVVILPTHRAIRGVDPQRAATLLSRLEEGFEISEFSGSSSLLEALRGESGCIGLLLGRQPRAFLLREAGARARLPESLHESARELDVNLLHLGILEPLLGIGEAELVSQKHVDYYRDESEVLSGLGSGRYQLAFLLNPTTAEQVRRVSEAGGRMPQKSTDFFPKLLTGLVFMKMEIVRDEKGMVGE